MNPESCGHCGAPIVQASRGWARGVVLCHTGTLPPQAPPMDCYRLVTLWRHRVDGRCCRREAA